MPTQTYSYRAPNGKTIDVTSDHPLAAEEVRRVFKAAGMDLSLPGDAEKPSVGSQLLRGATATLPVMGGVLGGIAGSAGPPILGTMAGVGGGTALGEGLRGLIHQYAFGDRPNPGAMLGSGAVAGAGAGALSALPAATSALSPSSVLSDVERLGTISPGKLGAEMLKRAARALRPGPSAILRRPPWQQTAEPDRSVIDQVDRYKPNVGGIPDRGIPQGQMPAPPPRPGPLPILHKGGASSVEQTIQDALEEARSSPSPRGTTPPPQTQTPAGKPSVTSARQAELEVPAGGGLAEDLSRMRREYGADRVGRAVNPNAPEAGAGTVLRADPTQAPSAMPDVAQRAVLRDLQAGTSKNPAATARAIQQLLTEYKRNAGPAKSPVAQELAALLKKHGFVKE